MHLSYIFQSQEFFSIVNGSLKKSTLTIVADKVIWEEKNKQAIVAVLATLNSFHKAEVIKCTTSHAMWTQLQAYHDYHSYDCIIVLQEKYYGSKLSVDESIATIIGSLQNLARQLTDVGQPISDQLLISKSKCILPMAFDPLLLAWDNILVVNHILLLFQAWLVKFQHKLHDRVLSFEVLLDHVFFVKGSLPAPSKSHSSPIVEQKHEQAEHLARQKGCLHCYKCGKHSHFGKECPNDNDTSSFVKSPKKHKGPRSDRKLSQRKTTFKGKRSYANVTAKFVSLHSEPFEFVTLHSLIGDFHKSQNKICPQFGMPILWAYEKLGTSRT